MVEPKFTEYADSESKRLLDDLLHCAQEDHKGYQAIMRSLGHCLANVVADKIRALATQDIYVVCTVEDADFLARGVIEEFESLFSDEREIKLACFWNKEKHVPHGHKEFETAPILKTYEEPVSTNCVMVVVKSIVSGACVVATNIMHAATKLDPAQILVVAPVMLDGAEERLASNFDWHVSRRFDICTFRIDFEKADDGNVKPGIGGAVYGRYGFGDATKKNLVVPEIVRSRRTAISQ